MNRCNIVTMGRVKLSWMVATVYMCNLLVSGDQCRLAMLEGIAIEWGVVFCNEWIVGGKISGGLISLSEDVVPCSNDKTNRFVKLKTFHPTLSVSSDASCSARIKTHCTALSPTNRKKLQKMIGCGSPSYVNLVIGP